MKVLRGTAKGKNIICPARIRPVSITVRRAAFDILRDVIEGARVLDLFAGSGSLGIEALSCGAKEAVFVDIKKASIEAVKKNLNALKFKPLAHICLKDAFKAVKDLCAREVRFDLIFLDPPYYKGLLKKALQALDKYDILAPSGYIVGFCYSKDGFVQKSDDFSLILQKNYGQTSLIIYRKNEESSLSRHI